MIDRGLKGEKIKLFYGNFSIDQIETVKEYFSKRSKSRDKEYFKIVFDISSSCNLNCRGCGTSAFKISEHSDNGFTSFKDISDILQKINKFSEKCNVKPFIYLGGGEPLLHPEIVPIVKMASEFFERNVGVDTNATANGAFNTIVELLPYLSYVGISLNGVKEYHNWWTKTEDSYEKTIEVIKKLCREGLSEHFEVTSIATKKNIDDYEKFVRLLKEIGVVNFSIHRAMPVGRMLTLMDFVPNNIQYFKLLCFVANNAKDDFNIHLHHSIEELHAALLLDEVNEYNKLGNLERSSAISINFDGNVYFDPWCTSGCWRNLNAGNLLKANSLEELLDKKKTQFYVACQSVMSKDRCNSCQIHCSGGSRVAAASNAIFMSKSVEPLEELLAIDPACPLYEEGE